VQCETKKGGKNREGAGMYREGKDDGNGKKEGAIIIL